MIALLGALLLALVSPFEGRVTHVSHGVADLMPGVRNPVLWADVPDPSLCSDGGTRGTGPRLLAAEVSPG